MNEKFKFISFVVTNTEFSYPTVSLLWDKKILIPTEIIKERQISKNLNIENYP